MHCGLRVAHLGRSSVRFEIGIFRNAETAAAAQGHFVHVCCDRDTHRPIPMPEDMHAALEKLRVMPVKPRAKLTSLCAEKPPWRQASIRPRAVLRVSTHLTRLQSSPATRPVFAGNVPGEKIVAPALVPYRVRAFSTVEKSFCSSVFSFGLLDPASDAK